MATIETGSPASFWVVDSRAGPGWTAMARRSMYGRDALLGRQSRLHTAFSIQLGKGLFQLIELLAGLAVLALGGQPLIV